MAALRGLGAVTAPPRLSFRVAAFRTLAPEYRPDLAIGRFRGNINSPDRHGVLPRSGTFAYAYEWDKPDRVRELGAIVAATLARKGARHIIASVHTDITWLPRRPINCSPRRRH